MKLFSLSKTLIILISTFILIRCGSGSEGKNNNDKSSNGTLAADTFNLKTYDTAQFKIPDFVPASTFPYFEDGKWGFAKKGGEIVIPCQYDKCGFFTDGVAWVVKGKKYGLINKKGKLILDYIYDEIGPFKDGMLPVKRNTLWGFIDTTGKQLLPFLFEDFELQDNKTIHVKQNNQWGIVDRSGKHIIQPIYNNNFEFRNGLAIVERRGNMGVINKNGKEVVDCKYHNIERINDTLFIANTYISYKNNLFGVINGSGKIKIPIIYQKIQNTFGQAVIAENNGKFGLLNYNNDSIIKFEYDNLKSGNTNLLTASRGGRFGFIDFRNNIIIPFDYKDAYPFINQLAIVESGGLYGVINNQNKTIIPFEFSKITQVDNKIFKVEKNNNYGFYNDLGEKLTEVEFDELDYHAEEDYTGYRPEEMTFGKFVNGFAIVGKYGRVGMINEKGEIIVPLKYHHLTPFDRNGMAVANFKNRKTLVNNKGKELMEPKFEDIDLDNSCGYYYTVKNLPTNFYEKKRKMEYCVGYFDFDGFYYGKSLYNNIHFETEDEIVETIRNEYKNIINGEKSRKYENVRMDNDLKGSYSDERFIVSDDKNKIRYEYYYNDLLNRYGPFFIFITNNSSGSKKENRYYFKQGKIVRWVGEDGKTKPISDAIYCPEEENHRISRVHVIMFNNTKMLKKNAYNSLVAKIDALCNKISDDVSAGLYKKGDSDNVQMGEYTSSHDIYTDKSGKTIYERTSQSDEGGSIMTETYFQNGEKIREFSENNYEELNDEDRNSGWFPDSYNLTTYYKDGSPIRTYKTNAGIDEIENF